MSRLNPYERHVARHTENGTTPLTLEEWKKKTLETLDRWSEGPMSEADSAFIKEVDHQINLLKIYGNKIYGNMRTIIHYKFFGFTFWTKEVTTDPEELIRIIDNRIQESLLKTISSARHAAQ